MTLDSGETIRVVIPEAVCLGNNSTTYLLCDTQFLLAGHSYISDLRKPQIQIAQGGTYTMDVIAPHKITKLLPISHMKRQTTELSSYIYPPPMNRQLFTAASPYTDLISPHLPPLFGTRDSHAPAKKLRCKHRKTLQACASKTTRGNHLTLSYLVAAVSQERCENPTPLGQQLIPT